MNSSKENISTLVLNESYNESPTGYDKQNDPKVSPSSNSIVLCLQFLLRCLKYVRVEVVTFVYLFGYIIRSVSSMTMIIHKVCRIDIGFSEDICANLTGYHDEKSQVENMANNYHLYHTLIEMAPAALLACFLGPWSDKYGRKVPICVAFCGIIIDGIGTVLCAYYLDTKIGYYMLPPIFTALSGGFIGVFTILYSYITDIAAAESRTFKFALMELSMGLGLPLGTVAGGWIYKYYGLVPVFETSVAAHIFGLIWALFIIEETRGMDNKDSWSVKLRNLFSLERLKESYQACMKPRPHRGRMQIWLLLFAMSVSMLGLAGTAIIAYLYVYHHYNWSNTKYSTVSAIFVVFGLLLMLISVPILKKCCKMGDPFLGIIGSVSNIAKNIGVALAAKEGVYYLANLLGLFGGLATLAGRARISKIVSQNDTGKVFAFLSTVESIVPIIATSIISQVFNLTKDIFPDPSYLSIGLVSLFPLVVFIWIAMLPNVDYEEITSIKNKIGEELPSKTEENIK